MPFFSVIIPTFNRCDFVCEAVDSVLAQTEQDFELIVVDDGSSDGTGPILQERYGARLVLLEQANRGPSSARNLGGSQARGKYLAFLDSDDLWMPRTLAIYRAVIEGELNPTVVTSVPFETPLKPDMSFENSSERQSNGFDDFFSSCDCYRSFGAGLTVVDRRVFLGVGGYSTDLVNAEDLDFMLRVGDAEGYVEISKPPVVAWRQHEDNLTRNVVATGNGLSRIISREFAGEYPGGRRRRWQRRRIISRHVRAHSLACLNATRWRDGWAFYSQTAFWNLREGRLRYLCGFPLIGAARVLQTQWQSRTHPNQHEERPLQEIEQ